MAYGDENCNCDCPEQPDLNLPDACGDECAEVINTNCVIYTGEGIGAPVLVNTDDDLTTIITTLVEALQEGVSALVPDVTVTSPATVNEVAYGAPAAVSIIDTDAGDDANFAFTFDIPAGAPGEDSVMYISSTDTHTLADTGSKTFTYAEIDNLGITTTMRVRIAIDATNFMEGIVSAVSSTSITVALDYSYGTGTSSAWTIGVTGQVGDGGRASSVDEDTGNHTATMVAYGSPATVAVTNTGSSVDAVFKFDFEIPNATGINTAAVNVAGDLIITLDDLSTVNAGSVVGAGLAPGGTALQYLAKVDGTDYNTQWLDMPVSSAFLAGGATGEIFYKDSATDYDGSWALPPLGAVVPPATTWNAVPIIFAGSEAELVSAISLFNATETGYDGCIIVLSGDITLSGNISDNFDGVQIYGNGVHSINHRPLADGGTTYTLIVNSGSPIFKDVVFTQDYLGAENGTGQHVKVLEIDNATSVPSVVKFESCIYDNIAMSPAATLSNVLLTRAPIGSEVIFKNCGIQTALEVDLGGPKIAIRLNIESTSNWNGVVTISDMKWLKNTELGQSVAPAAPPPPGSETSSIYFEFIGTWNTDDWVLLNIDMESYAESELNGNFGATDNGNIYIHDSLLMYGDNSAAAVSLKPNKYGTFGWYNPTGAHPLVTTAYS